MLTRKEPNTRVERAVQELERMIFSGELTSGEHIKESEIGELLALSRGVVREAFTSLAQAGLVEVIPHRGVFVRSFTLKETLDFFDLRAHLALYAVKEASQNVTRRELAELGDILERLDNAVDEADPTEMMNLNCQFHQNIFRKCENTALVEFAEDIRLKQYLSCRHTFRVATTGAEASREHRVILDALVDGDGDLAAKLMHDHILQGKRRFLESIKHEE